MAKPPVNSEEDYYAEEPFEEDSMSDAEDVEEEEDIEEDTGSIIAVNDDGTALSDSQSESDPELEFIRGNVSEQQPQKLNDNHHLHQDTQIPIPPIIKNNIPDPPQPHARRQSFYGKRVSGGFNRERMREYPSSSSEDEVKQVTQTVVEVNKLVMMNLDPVDDEAPSERTIVPSSDANDEHPISEVEEELKNNENDQYLIVNGNDLQSEEDEEVVDDEEAAENTEEDYDDGGLDDQDVVQNQINKDENYAVVEDVEDDDDDDIAYSKLLNDIEMNEMVDMRANVIEPSSSDETEDPGLAEEYARNIASDADTDITLTPRQDPSPQPMPRTIFQPQPQLRRYISKPQLQQYTFDSMQATGGNNHLLNQLNELLSDDEDDNYDDDEEVGDNLRTATFRKDSLKADAAAVKFLEHQMTQMSDMIMKSFRINGDTNAAIIEESNVTSSELDAEENEILVEPPTDYIESEPVCDRRGSCTPLMCSSMETLPTVQSAKPTNRRKCRCPSLTDESEQSLLMDECGQGDGLRRHMPPSRRNIDYRVSSVTPNSFNTDNCACHINLIRPRSSSDKVNYKNLGRKSYSFTNAQVREIERQNNILLKKMMSIKPTIKVNSNSQQAKTKQPVGPSPPRPTNAAVNRKKYQRQIDLDNDVLKRKLEAIGTRRPIFK